MSASPDPYLRALGLLTTARVDFVVVGVGGINFYARGAGDLVVTQDLDLLLAPAAENLRRALATLTTAGFELSAGGEPFLDSNDPVVLEAIVRRGATLSAWVSDGAQIDLMLSIEGFSFRELTDDAEQFQIGEQTLRVGRLEKLISSKERSARPKDLEFLRLYAARLRGSS